MAKKIAWSGIDAGLTGCACLLTESEIRFHDFKIDDPAADSKLCEVKAAETIDWWNSDYNVKFCLEKVSMVNRPASLKLDGETSNPFFGSNPKLITNYGFWRGVLVAHNCNWMSKTPGQWQKIMPGKKLKGEDTKDRVLLYAKKFYPAAAGHLALKKYHNRADALLMAHFVRVTEL